eukprot:CAMPEP_0206580486 /NCGR_PEP_ID=MMETSP0325_2-20121206/33196_1 /ASSEMBLY_ACC=CAM_ASM_000347 /TAXON_ID=2866 /ORGANISM="Crypthecodinium cohnii, Strain Seligo" /LENGTH=75 /DNA_ID=CAMNT_0054086543 /DNA_START=543 /DNA_END=767 /DNA_ORIENTATION=-
MKALPAHGPFCGPPGWGAQRPEASLPPPFLPPSLLPSNISWNNWMRRRWGSCKSCLGQPKLSHILPGSLAGRTAD